jgi:hypothetical protein
VRASSLWRGEAIEDCNEFIFLKTVVIPLLRFVFFREIILELLESVIDRGNSSGIEEALSFVVERTFGKERAWLLQEPFILKIA